MEENKMEMKKGIDQFQLKLIAIAAMLVDHLAFVFLPQGGVLTYCLRFLGRLTGPIMFFCAAEGYAHTRNVRRYLLRLFCFALISYFPFVLMEAKGDLAKLDFLQLNVIYTIFLGVLGIHIRHNVKKPLAKGALLLFIFLLSLPGDWSYIGVSLILVFDYFHGDFRAQAVSYTLITLFGTQLFWVLIRPVQQLLQQGIWQMDWAYFLQYGINLGMFLPLILLRYYNGQRGTNSPLGKWLFYLFYPVHLLVIAGLAFLFPVS